MLVGALRVSRPLVLATLFGIPATGCLSPGDLVDSAGTDGVEEDGDGDEGQRGGSDDADAPRDDVERDDDDDDDGAPDPSAGDSGDPDECNYDFHCDPWESEATCPVDCGAAEACNDNGTCDPGEDASNCPADCQSGACNNDGRCEPPEDPASCPDDCQAAGPCDNDGLCEPPEDPASCPNDCMGMGGGGCDNDSMCEPGEDPMSCPGDCMGMGGGACDNDGMCEPPEDPGSCPNDCMGGGGGGGGGDDTWWLEGVETPAIVDPATIPSMLEDFPAPDEVICELPHLCPGPVTTFADPWTGAHQEMQLTRSRNEITQVEARGQRAWTYFSLLSIEGDADTAYPTELGAAMRVDLDGTTYPLESGTLNVHPAREGLWDYLSAAGAARIADGGRVGIEIDGGFFGTMCFDSDTVAGFGPWLAANLDAGQLTELEDDLADAGFPGVTVDGSFDYQVHLTTDRGFPNQAAIGGEARLLKIDQQWDHYVHERVFGFMDSYLADIDAAASAAGQSDFPVMLNRSEGDALWTAAERGGVIGGETFINENNIHYPSEHRMAPYFRQGQVLGKRVWSWNSPRILHPSQADTAMDTTLVFVAENDAAGGLLQVPDGSISYPLCPPEEPLCSATQGQMDALWAKVGPYLSYREKIRTTLAHPSEARTLVVEMMGLPYTVWDGDAENLHFASLGIGALLADHQIDYDLTGWADGDYRHRLAETPWVTQPMLDSYEWIVLAEPQYLSDNQIAMLNAFMAGGGKVMVLLYNDATCSGGDEVACELKAGCRFDAAGPSCGHAIDALTGTLGTELFVVEDVNVMDYRDDAASHGAIRTAFETGLTGVTLPRELSSAADLNDLAAFQSHRVSDDAHILHLVNYAWDEGALASVTRSSFSADVAIPARLEGRTVNVTWFSAPDQRDELLTGVTLGTGGGVTLSVTIPEFHIWGTLVITEGDHELFSAPRARPPYVKVRSENPGPGDWQFEFEAVSSTASLDRGYLWGREMVETSPQQWEPTGDWKAVYEVDFTEGGTVDPGLKADVIFSIPRPQGRYQYYATACDANDLCQPFIPWAVMTRPPSP